jgi:hypothetical protein
MTYSSVVNNIELLLALGGLVWLFYGPWQHFVVDVLRQNIFRLRDGLFLEAADGHISFSSPEYRAVRDRLNAMIRYAHTATWSHVLALSIIGPKGAKAFDINGITARVNNRDIAAKMKRAFQRAIYYTMLAIVARSLFLIFTNMVFAPVVLVMLLLNASGIRDGVSRVGHAIDRDVEVEQGRKLPAAQLS